MPLEMAQSWLKLAERAAEGAEAVPETAETAATADLVAPPAD
jgi:hypothetical protein